MEITSKSINFDKGNGLVPVIAQHFRTREVLMLGYMNAEAFEQSQKEQKLTFFSRSKDRLWTKGETSGNYLNLKELKLDCDQDTILALVEPQGNTCHKDQKTCFGDESANQSGFLYTLEEIIASRKAEFESGKGNNSYTIKLFKRGLNKIIQKFGEEAVEVVIEAKDDSKEKLTSECADLLYHFLVMLSSKDLKLAEIEKVLAKRNK